jgi:hypothetical protein
MGIMGLSFKKVCRTVSTTSSHSSSTTTLHLLSMYMGSILVTTTSIMTLITSNVPVAITSNMLYNLINKTLVLIVLLSIAFNHPLVMTKLYTTSNAPHIHHLNNLHLVRSHNNPLPQAKVNHHHHQVKVSNHLHQVVQAHPVLNPS